MGLSQSEGALEDPGGVYRDDKGDVIPVGDYIGVGVAGFGFKVN